MIIEQSLMKFGLSNDENNSKLKEVFKDKIKLKEIHIDIFPTNPLVSSQTPYTLLLRTIEKKITVANDGNRLILKNNTGKVETHFVNVLLSEIKECYYKTLDIYSEFILNIQNIWYRITVLN